MGKRKRPQIELLKPMAWDIMTIHERVLPSDWIETCMVLSRSYATQGRVTLLPWQREIPNAFLEYDEITMIAPTQTGKSMLEEGLLGYCIDQAPENVMILYAKRETVEDVFDERLKPLITETPELRRYWDGDPDNLTKRRLKLTHMVARVGSASSRTDIASHNAGVVFGDEVAKWNPRGKEKYDPVKLLHGRTHGSRMMGKQVRYIYATSPRIEGDPSHKLAMRQGTRFCQPHIKCPHCGHWQVLIDSQIKEKPAKRGAQPDHNPERIRDTGAAWYECIKCRHEITEAERTEASEKVVWAAVDMKTLKPVEVIGEDGLVSRQVLSRRIVFNWNRLVDVTWTFAECLAAYFEALQSPDGNTLADYQNEDMARWVHTNAKRFSEGWLEKKAKSSHYKQFGADAYIPEQVSVLVIGVDTQDDGFYFVVRGFGPNLESWLIRAEFIKCDMDAGAFVNPGEVHSAVMSEIQRYPYQKKDGTKLPILAGLIDRGGHRSDDVDYICGHSPFLQPYIGSTRKDRELIRRSDKGFFLGNTEQLSRTVEKWMQSEIWHLPRDIQAEYCRQVLNQHEQEYTDTRGNTRRRWVTGDDTGQPDHFRDCENMIVGATVIMDLQGMLFSDVGQKVVAAAGKQPEPQPDNSPEQRAQPERNNMNVGGASVNDWLSSGGWGT
jgi:phage terminase large subunit GpA-like protein